MARDPEQTRRHIVAAADELFYAGGLRDVGVDEIAARAGVTKKTLYYHFRSKDDLFAAYLAARDRPTLARFQQWAGMTGCVAERMERMFLRLAEAARRQTWKGCGFVRAAAELADRPGHPGLDAARAHKRAFEAWLRDTLRRDGYDDADDLAACLMILVDGAVTRMLVDREARHAEAAARAARHLLARPDLPAERPGDLQQDGALPRP